MKNLLLLLIALCVSPLLYAQAKLDLPKSTDAQKTEMLAFNSTMVHAASIAYAKSVGKTPKEYGQAIGKLFIPIWAQAKTQAKAQGKQLEGVVQQMHGIAQAYNCPFELLTWSEKEAVIKRGLLLQDPKLGGMFTSQGVTAQEMEDWEEAVMAEFLKDFGVSLARHQEGQQVIITLKKL